MMRHFVYKAAIGHDNIGGLVRLTTQPRCPGLTRAVWIPSAIGDQPNGAQTTKLLWDGGTTPDKINVALTQLGLTSEMPVAVTLTLPTGIERSVGYYNCYVSYPKNVEFHYFVRSPQIDVRIEEQIG